MSLTLYSRGRPSPAPSTRPGPPAPTTRWTHQIATDANQLRGLREKHSREQLGRRKNSRQTLSYARISLI